MLPYPIWYSRLNSIVEISIQGYFDEIWAPLLRAIHIKFSQITQNKYGSLGSQTRFPLVQIQCFIANGTIWVGL